MPRNSVATREVVSSGKTPVAQPASVASRKYVPVKAPSSTSTAAPIGPHTATVPRRETPGA